MVESPEAVAAVQILIWPVLFLSNTFVAPETMPGWLGAISEWNPVGHRRRHPRTLRQPRVGRRDLDSPELTAHGGLVADSDLRGLLPLSVRRYRHLSR